MPISAHQALKLNTQWADIRKLIFFKKQKYSIYNSILYIESQATLFNIRQYNTKTAIVKIIINITI